MFIQSAIEGGYPRVGDSHEGQRLRRAIGELDVKKITLSRFKAVQDDVTKEVIKEQEAAGMDIVTDGMIRWGDPFSYVAGRLGGFSVNGLIRYFDTNFYYRQPEAKGKIKWTSPVLVSDFKFAKNAAKRAVKVVMAGPYTLCTHSKNFSYKNGKVFVMDTAKALNKELLALQKAGCGYVQIDEPNIVKNKKDIGLFCEAFRALTSGLNGKMRVGLTTFFGDVTGIYKDILKLPFQVLGLDFVDGKENFKLVNKDFSKELQAGLIDARNTKMENKNELETSVLKLAKCVNPHALYVSPNCSLEFLPRDKAAAKMKLIASVVKSLR